MTDRIIIAQMERKAGEEEVVSFALVLTHDVVTLANSVFGNCIYPAHKASFFFFF